MRGKREGSWAEGVRPGPQGAPCQAPNGQALPTGVVVGWVGGREGAQGEGTGYQKTPVKGAQSKAHVQLPVSPPRYVS